MSKLLGFLFLALVLMVALVPAGHATSATITTQPVRSFAFLRSEQFQGTSWLTELAVKPVVITPIVTATTIHQCRYWDLYEKPFTIYSHGSAPAHLLTFKSGRYAGCTLFLSGATPEARLAGCQATCSVSGCSVNDCAQATLLDGYWSAK